MIKRDDVITERWVAGIPARCFHAMCRTIRVASAHTAICGLTIMELGNTL